MKTEGNHSATCNNFAEKISQHDENGSVHETPLLSAHLVLDHVGEVLVSLNSSGLSWQPPVDDQAGSCCCGRNLASRKEAEIAISDTYAVELNDWGFIHRSILPKTGLSFLDKESEMYSFSVYGIQKSEAQPSSCLLPVYTFGHKDLHICRMFVDQINNCLRKERGRPKSLLVFVHPFSGKRKGRMIWETVAPIFCRAQVRTEVRVTERAGHAFDIMASLTNEELSSYDGVVAVGGDGFFNEVLNGLLSFRLKTPHPEVPPDFVASPGKNSSGPDRSENNSGTSCENEDENPLLASWRNGGSIIPNLNTEDGNWNTGEDVELCIPNKSFRFGIIPAGSTDAIVICTTGVRDPVTSALHIVLGKSVRLDITQVVKWKTALASKIEPCVRYTASFTGYGFYGDVVQESEKYRWMGPKRYDVAGTKVFLRHRSYDAEVSYLEVESNKVGPSSGGAEKIICRANCKICNNLTENQSVEPYRYRREGRWLRTRGRYLSIGAAVITCRNEKAPDGLVADAHLSDGYLHLILIKRCSHLSYLWHLLNVAQKGGKPLDFTFVEHHKTPAFAFTSFGKQSVWNLDGELVEAHKLSAQVFRGLISLFATGPEV